MLQLLITWAGVTQDYTAYVDQTSIQIQEQLNTPSTMQFKLTAFGGNFMIPPQMSYVQLVSTTVNAEYSPARVGAGSPDQLKQSIYSGYISSPPNIEFLGLSPYALPNTGGHLFNYAYQAVSDEILLNLKAVPFIPAYINRTQGQILIDLIAQLVPGMFDVSNILDGDIVPFYSYTPTQNWSQVAKQFADASRFRYKCRDHKVWFAPYGDGAFGISYDEDQPQSTFKPNQLNLTPISVPIVNDVIVVGDAEAGTLHKDYFVGDGFTANFQLKHKVYHGSSSVLLTDDWTEAALNAQQWYLQDPGQNFSVGSGALNVITPVNGGFAVLGQSYLAMNNGLELAGGINIEHGEFIFNNSSHGMIGGIYTDDTFTVGALIAGWNIYPSSTITTSASGAAGIQIAPYVPPAGNMGYNILSQVNHSYVLETLIQVPAATRYKRIYRSAAQTQAGGTYDSLTGSITFIVGDYDIAQATGYYYTPNSHTFTYGPALIPAFATYALVNNLAGNFIVRNTQISVMPLGALEAYVPPNGNIYTPSGIVLPAYNDTFPFNPDTNSGHAYHGSVTIITNSIGPQPGANAVYPFVSQLQTRFPVQLILGGAQDVRIAQVTQGNETDQLSFYAQTVPSAGYPIAFTSWESQAAVSRVRDQNSIAMQAAIVGDNGLRTAIITDMNPLPRTSEDADNAAIAYLSERTNAFYNGTYQSESIHFVGGTFEAQYWPTVGRYFNVNAPYRGVLKQAYLVTQLTTTVLSLADELLNFNFQFGADLYLDKLLKNFVDIHPDNVLSPKDTAQPPQWRYITDVGSTYLPDINTIRINYKTITGWGADITIDNPIATPGAIEIRRIDANWGHGATPDYVASIPTDQVGPWGLARRQYDKSWYFRRVYNNGGTIQISRRATCLRVVWPNPPIEPIVVSVDSHFVQLNFNGDVRNISVLEIAQPDNTIILQKPIFSYTDLNIDLTNTPNTLPWTSSRIIYCRFANLNWEYSFPAQFNWQGHSASAAIYIASPKAPVLSLIERSGGSITVNALIDSRQDITIEEWDIFSDPSLSSDTRLQQIRFSSQTGSVTFSGMPSGTLYVTCTRSDYLGAGPSSATLTVS